MRKCDFCKYADMENGKLVCRFIICQLSQKEINEILEKLAKLIVE